MNNWKRLTIQVATIIFTKFIWKLGKKMDAIAIAVLKLRKIRPESQNNIFEFYTWWVIFIIVRLELRQ